MDLKQHSWGAFAADLGASSGRTMLGMFDGSKLCIEELHRFRNNPVQLNDTVFWDFLSLFSNVENGLRKALLAGYEVRTIGVDSWGVDFGLLDVHGELMSNPRHYRNSFFTQMVDEVFKIIPQESLFEKTGIQTLPFNTIFQVMYLKCFRPEFFARSHRLLLIPDLVNYFLTGELAAEYTIASTTQLLGAKGGMWAEDIMKKLMVESELFSPVVKPFHRLGSIRIGLFQSTDAAKIRVVNVGEHDTASAVFAVPFESRPYVYISSGTWSLVGTCTDTPAIETRTLEMNFTNEGAVDGTYRLLKNVAGLWLIQEVQRIYESHGESYSFEMLTLLGKNAGELDSIIDPDAPSFLAPSNMIEAVQAWCLKTAQLVPRTPGEIARTIYQSLALKYRWVIEKLEEITQDSYPSVHVVGGGARNELLCQWTADATQKPVVAGPIEATIIGNISAQLVAEGEISIRDLSHLVRSSFQLKTYLPRKDSKTMWDERYGRFIQLLQQEVGKGEQDGESI